jgi:hypothetical protein
MSSGWICLHRKLLDWEWYDDANVSRLFIHCLLRANHKPKKWKGKVIPAGSFISGRIKLSEETGLSEQQIRTCLDKLKSTSDLTIKPTNRNSLITVTGWASYQDRDEKVTSQITSQPPSKQPTDNQQITTNNNVNNETSSSKDRAKPKKRFTPPAIQEVKDYFIKLNSSDAHSQAERFVNHYESNGWQVGKNKMKCWKAAVRNWMTRSSSYEANRSNNQQPRKLSFAEQSAANTERGLAILEAEESGLCNVGGNETFVLSQVASSGGRGF